MTTFYVREEFLGMTDNNLQTWEMVLVDEINNGPRETVRITRLELDILRQVMAERNLTVHN